MQQKIKTSFVIRTASAKDATSIATIHVRGWQTTYQGLMPEDVLNNLSITESTQQWRDRLEKNECQALVAEFKHQAVGFVSFCPCRDDDVDPNKTAEISAIYLLPEYKGQGLGYQLMEQTLAILRHQKYQDVILWALAENKAAQNFYQKMGFGFELKKNNTDRIVGTVLCDYRYRKTLK